MDNGWTIAQAGRRIYIYIYIYEVYLPWGGREFRFFVRREERIISGRRVVDTGASSAFDRKKSTLAIPTGH